MGKKAYMKEAADVVGLTYYQLSRLAKEGKVPFVFSGNRRIFDIHLLEECLMDLAKANIKPIEESKQYGILRRVETS